LHCPSRDAFVIEPTSGRLSKNRASYVVDGRRTLIISVSHKAALYRAERATNSPSHCAAATIAKFIAAATKPHGGEIEASMRSRWRARFGSRLIRFLKMVLWPLPLSPPIPIQSVGQWINNNTNYDPA
jgi:hypothetical protein